MQPHTPRTDDFGSLDRSRPGARASGEPAGGRAGTLAWLAVVAVALALRAWEATEASLWLDELHTLVHAGEPTLGAVAAHVARDNHTPLFFWAVHLFGGWEQAAWLRALPALTSVLVFLPLAALARRAGGQPARAQRAALLAALIVAALPYQVYFSAMLRPYAWVGVFSAGAAWVAFREEGSRPARFALFFLFVLAGLWTHRVMALVVAGIGFARLFVRRPGMLGLGWLILAGTLAVLPSVPWLMHFAERVTDERFDFHERVGGYRLRPALVKEVLALPLRLCVPFMGVLGAPWNALAKLGALAFFGSAGAALAAWITARRRGAAPPWSPQLRALFLFGVATFVLITASSLWSWDRVPLQYYTPIAWIPALFLAVWLCDLPGATLRRGLTGVCAVAALALGAAQAGGRATEDMRGAVAACRAEGQRLRADGLGEPIYTALLAQPPEIFPHTSPYLAYGRDLAAIEPESSPKPGEPEFERPLIVLRREVALWRPEWQALAQGRRIERERRIDDYLSVFVLVPR